MKLSDLNPHKYPTTPEIDKNLSDLLSKLIKLEAAYGKPFHITSGLRDQAQQDALIAAGKSNAPKSLHLKGLAGDIADPSGQLYDWAKANEQILAYVGIFCEERMGGWLHCQTLPPRSGKRWFFP